MTWKLHGRILLNLSSFAILVILGLSFSVSELTECVLWTILVRLNVKLPTWNDVCTCDSCVTCPTLMAA